MLPRTYEQEICSIAATLEVLGDRWTLLIARDACLGVTRFADFQARLGIARTVLSDRLARLTEAGVFERRRYSEQPERFEYVLTERGRDIWPILNSLMTWGDRHLKGGEAPFVIHHRGCGGHIDDRRRCETCGQEVGVTEVVRLPGPGARRIQPQPPAESTASAEPAAGAAGAAEAETAESRQVVASGQAG
ncbi:helix-turn-helix transcriptional regulator [Frankia sp. Ag45/Mut15]|uniref:Helix-turn-helix transcriptional regulator n=1 Tax=Frankia umida TaxID=573489 RepID=A0ABT0JXJ8_9ACTN|nr:helix-turn-helix domain-containing protein [Frankia umida]MCK9875733.1 helix-turn-helix transcriptional regulator [Frankia umida]